MITAAARPAAVAAILATAAAGVLATAPATLPAALATSSPSVALTAGFEPFRPFIETVTAQVPVVTIGGVTIGGKTLSNAYYNGYNGFTGLGGITAAVVFPAVQTAVDGLGTALRPIIQQSLQSAAEGFPVTNVGGIEFGGGRFVNDFYDGYRKTEGESYTFVTGTDGIAADIADQLKALTNPAPAATRTAPRRAAAVAGAAAAVSAVTVAAAKPASTVKAAAASRTSRR